MAEWARALGGVPVWVHEGDRRWGTYMRRHPNYIPLAGNEAARVVEALRPWRCDRLYGWALGRVTERDAKQAVERSLERDLRALGALGALRVEHDVVASAL